MTRNSQLSRYIAAISALLIAPLSYASTALYLLVTGGDTDGSMKPALMLGLPESSQHLLGVSMVFDAAGNYALVLIVGGYLWSRLRPSSDGTDDIAVCCLGLFTALGVVGAMLLAAALSPLSQIHSADPAMRPGAESAWLGLASGVERGLWMFEYLPFALWCLITAPRLRAIGARHGWLLMVAGWAWALYFVGGVLQMIGLVPPGAADLVEAPALFGLAVTPLWALLSGIGLLRGGPEPGPLSAGVA